MSLLYLVLLLGMIPIVDVFVTKRVSLCIMGMVLKREKANFFLENEKESVLYEEKN